MMHKGWLIVLIMVLIQAGLGFLIYFSVRDGNDTGESVTETIADDEISSFSVTGELAFLPAALLPDAQHPDEGEIVCVRICAVPSANAPLLAGDCSSPLSIVGSVDDEEGENWLAADVPAATSKDYYPFLAARRRFVVISS